VLRDNVDENGSTLMANIETQSAGEIGAVPRPRPPSGASAPRRRTKFAAQLSILAGLAIWELVSRMVVANALFLAAPTQIFAAITALAISGELWPHISISAAEFAVGYAIASFLGVVIGLAMASSDLAKKVLQPWISGLYATPTIALARFSFSGSGSASGRRCWW
jgi:ABC-type nitrate/sulfonate/bicarbonate transport system permease component